MMGTYGYNSYARDKGEKLEVEDWETKETCTGYGRMG
jgi:hypothetical protein